jgi:hypothetical protein
MIVPLAVPTPALRPVVVVVPMPTPVLLINLSPTVTDVLAVIVLTPEILLKLMIAIYLII